MRLQSKGIYLTVCILFYLAIGSSASRLMAETLTNPRMIFTASNPSTVSVGDFNGDGKPDLAYLDGGFPVALHILLGNGDGTFQPGQDIPLPSGIGGAITVADVNNDGRLDLILGGSDPTRQVGVFLGNGDGTFGPIIISVLPINLFLFSDFGFRFGVADLNGDGALDLIVSDPLNDAIYSLLGDNTGSFTLQATIFNGGAPGTILTGDFNGDGKPDFLTLEGLGAEVTVYLGIGDGSFQPGVSYTNGTNRITSVVLADMDGDGRVDMVVTDFLNHISIFHGNADGTFSTTSSGGFNALPPPIGGTQPGLFAVRDFNGDGILDLAIISQNGVGILLGQENLTYAAPTTFVMGPNGAQVFDKPSVADFNIDGHSDIASVAPGGIALLLGNGNGTFQTFDTYTINQGGGGLAVADLTGDHIPDIIVGDGPTSSRILRNNGLGKFTPSISTVNGPGGVFSIVPGDFNGDGITDLFLTGSTMQGVTVSGTNAVLFGNGDGTFSAPLDLTLAHPGFSPGVIADLNHDGKADIVAIPTFQTMQVLLGQQANAFTPISTNFAFGLGVGGPAVSVDLNHDGIPDVVFSTFSDLQPLLGNGDGTFRLAPPIPIVIAGVEHEGPNALVVTDLDGDGNPDLVLSEASLPELEILYGKPDGTFEPPVLLDLSTPVTQLTVADMNNDGKPDLVMANQGTISNPGFIFVIHNNGGRSFGPEVHYLAGNIGNTLVVKDVNGDGLPDVVIGTGPTNLSVLLSQPGNSTLAGTVSLTPQSPALAQPLTVTLTLAQPTATGSVTFSIDSRPLGRVPLSSGVATLTTSDTSAFALGIHTLTALYSGDAAFTPATFARTISIVPFIHPTSVSLTASPNPAVASQTVHFTVTVTSAGPTPTGAVAIHDGSSTIGSISLDPTTGIGVFNTALLASGNHSITAIYHGDANSASGTSTAVPVVITSFATTTTLTILPVAPQAGASFALSATVTSASGSPAGSVSFFDGTGLLATRELDSSSTAVFTTEFSSPGTHSFTATYNANAQFAGSSSAAQSLSPAGAPAAASTLDLSVGQDAQANRLFLIAKAQPAAPGGKVVFFSSNISLGEATISSDGTATLEVAGVFPGTHYFSALLEGNNRVAGSAATVLVGTPLASTPEFAMHLSAPSAGLITDQPSSIQLEVDPLNGFSGQVALSCSSVSGVSCAFQPAFLNGGGKSVLTLRLATQQVGSVTPAIWTWRVFPGLIGATMLLPVLAFKRRRMQIAVAVFALICCATAIGCGGRGTQPNAPLTVTITATSSQGTLQLTHSVALQVLVAK